MNDKVLIANGKTFLWVLAIVRASGVSDLIDSVIRPNGDRGRPRSIRTDVWLTGFLVATVTGRRSLESRVHLLLTQELPVSLQVSLGIRKRRVIKSSRDLLTVRQVRYVLVNLARGLDQSAAGLSQAQRDRRRDILRAITTGLCAGTIPDKFLLLGSWAADNTAIHTWARPNTKNPETTGRPSVDRDASWGYRTPTYDSGDNDQVFGYHAAAYTVMCDHVPAYIEAVELRPANEEGVESALLIARELHRGLVSRGRVFGEILADREYSKAVPDRWHHPIRELGAELVLDLNYNDRIAVITYKNARFIDGYPYCPAMEDRLKDLQRPGALFEQDPPGPDAEPAHHDQWARTEAAIKAADKVNDEREPFALVRVAGNGAGHERFGCPAAYGKLRCPIREYSKQLPVSVPEVIPPPEHLREKNGICKQVTISVPPDIVPKLRQRHRYLTREWRRSYGRRTVVERSFGSMKHPANENVHRGWIELMGLVKTAFMLAIAAASQNLRLSLAHIREHDGHDPDDLILSGPETYYGHEETNEWGEVFHYPEGLADTPAPETDN
jgi:hypothetical protein